jgi:hypothetical protein
MSTSRLALLFGVFLIISACTPTGESGAVTTSTAANALSVLYPDVVGVEVTANQDGSFRFSVTLSSPYDTPERYADAWRVRDEDGTVYGIRELVHDHATEQPFTRSLDGVEIPPGVTSVVVEGRDQVSGWGGAVVIVNLPGRGE